MVEWAAREGWNPGLADADCFHAADPAGFLIGRIADRARRPASPSSPMNRRSRSLDSISSSRSCAGEATACVSGRREWRGSAIALSASTASLRSRRTTSDRVSCSPTATSASAASPIANSPRDSRVVPISANLVDAVSVYDRPFFPASRDAFLRCWLRPEQREGRALIEDGTVRGYGVIRPAGTASRSVRCLPTLTKARTFSSRARPRARKVRRSFSTVRNPTGRQPIWPPAMACRRCSRRRACIAVARPISRCAHLWITTFELG